MKLWKDGRSGWAGCMAGNLVLADIERSGDKITRRNGTTFTGQKSVFIGRMCAKDYLQKGQRHWANISPMQYQAIAMEASQQGKELEYLFVTATHEPPTVHYWKVPGKPVGEFLRGLPIKASDKSCWIRIREENGKQYLEGAKGGLKGPEVTQCHHEVPLQTGEAAALQQAFENPPPEEQGGEVNAEQLMRLNKQYLEGGKGALKGPEVTQCHHGVPLQTEEAAALQQAFINPPPKEEGGDINAEQLMRLNTLVRDLGGVATVLRALEILENLKA